MIEDPRVLSAIVIPSVTETHHPPREDRELIEDDEEGEVAEDDDEGEEAEDDEEGEEADDDGVQSIAKQELRQYILDQQLQERLAHQLAIQSGQTVSEPVRKHEQLQMKYVLILDVSTASKTDRRDPVTKLDVTLLYPTQALKQGSACADPLSPEGSLGSRFGLSSRTIELRSNHSQVVAVKVSMLLPVHGFFAVITQYRDSRGQPLKKTNSFRS